MNVQFGPAARQELLNALNWYLSEEGGVTVAEEFERDVQYLSANDLILVIAIAHQSREPGYWQGR